jgi:hypothetical protein
MQLRELQRELQRHLLGEDSHIVAAIVDTPPLPADARLAIYRNAYRVRLIDALDEAYSSLHKLLGDETFLGLGEMFIAAHPSVHRSIRWYGREIADFLSETPPFSAQPILAELAQFEWTLTEVFDAPDAAALDRTALTTIEPEAWGELRFSFHPSLRRVDLAWNAVPVWRAVSADAEPPLPELAPQPVPWLLWRQNLQNYFRSLDATEEAALKAATSGDTFAEICAAVSQWLPPEETPLRAATLVGLWADSGIIVGISQEPFRTRRP